MPSDQVAAEYHTGPGGTATSGWWVMEVSCRAINATATASPGMVSVDAIGVVRCSGLHPVACPSVVLSTCRTTELTAIHSRATAHGRLRARCREHSSPVPREEVPEYISAIEAGIFVDAFGKPTRELQRPADTAHRRLGTSRFL